MRIFLSFILLLFSSLVFAQDDILKKPVVVAVPDDVKMTVKRDIRYSDKADRLLADIFMPADTTREYPAVIFVHGGPIPDSVPIAAKNWGQYQSYGALIAANGMAGVVFNYRYSSFADSHNAREDVLALIDHVHNNAAEYGIDNSNVCIWYFSGGGSFIAPVLERHSEWIKCLSIYYAVAGPRAQANMGRDLPDNLKVGLDPFPVLDNKTDSNPALFIAEAGNDIPELNVTLREFTLTAIEKGWEVEFWNHPTGPHAFDILQDDARSRSIINRTIEFMKYHLK